MPPVFDLHCDTPLKIHEHKSGHVNTATLKNNGYCGAVFAHFVEPGSKQPFVDAVKLLTSTLEYLNGLPDVFLMRNYGDFEASRLNILLGVEGGHIFDRNSKQVEILFEMGARVFTITWNNSNRLAHSALESDNKGLTARGRDLLKVLASLDAIIDVSHASTRTVQDICERYEGKVIASHSCLRVFNPFFLRNIDDQAVRSIADRRGVVGINISRYHLGTGTPLEHIDYLKTNFGEHVPAFGSDFDGIDDAVLADPAEVQSIASEAKNKGYNDRVIEGFFSSNFLRLLKKV
ncbi:MAG TPA: membrane dipeptidase [bacterium]